MCNVLLLQLAAVEPGENGGGGKFFAGLLSLQNFVLTALNLGVQRRQGQDIWTTSAQSV